MNHLDKMYGRLPVITQHAAVSFYGLYWKWLRFGPVYGDFVTQYRKRENYSREQWVAYQHSQLKSLLPDVAKYVPYYHQTWTKTEAQSAYAGRLADLPLLEKNPIRENPESFLRTNEHPRRKLIFHTSGTSGTPIATIWTTSELRNSMALREVRSARWAGVSFDMSRATFSGRLVEPSPNSKGPFYRFNLAESQVYFSAFHLKPENASTYVHALKKHRIQWLTGYAVSYYLLAQFILELGLQVPPLKAVITTSEKVTPEMRRVMENAFGCKVYEEYSTVENSIFASECEQGRLHVSPDAGIVEILRPDGTHCVPDEVGEVVATCLMRTYQPLIRFRLGDLAAWDETTCPCGREMPVIKEVVGRIEDVVIGPDGRHMVRFHGIFVDQPHVIEGQIIQDTIDHILVKIVPTDGFSPNDVQDIAHRIQQRLGDQVKVSVKTVKQIPRTKAGKFQAVISHLCDQGVPEAERTGIETNQSKTITHL